MFFENLHGSGGSSMTARAVCGTADKPEKCRTYRRER
jgi:hypothetical protein